MLNKIKIYGSNRKYLLRWILNRTYRIDYSHDILAEKNLIVFNENINKWLLKPDIVNQLNNMFIGPNNSLFLWSDTQNGKCYLIVKVAFPQDLMILKLILGHGTFEYGF